MAARYVSTSVKRTEDPPLLMGRAHFMGDLKLPGLLAVKFLRSPHAHARILSIDVSAARALRASCRARARSVTGARAARHRCPARAGGAA